jgi:hypothetical protein
VPPCNHPVVAQALVQRLPLVFLLLHCRNCSVVCSHKVVLRLLRNLHYPRLLHNVHYPRLNRNCVLLVHRLRLCLHVHHFLAKEQ